jgi:hypothetical protein
MQIHEITESRVKEGFLGDLGGVAKGVGKNIFTAAGGGDLGPGNAAKSAAGSAAGLAAQGYGPNYQKPSEKWQDKYKQISTDPTIKQYAASIAQGWIKNSGNLIPASAGAQGSNITAQLLPILTSAGKRNKNTLSTTQIGQILAKGAPTIWKNTIDKSKAISELAKQLAAQGITVQELPGAGATTATTPATKPITKYSYNKPGQMSSELAGSKTGQNMQKMFGAPKGGIQDMQSDLNETISPAAEQYKQAFIQYTDQQFATKVPNTGETITMDMVRAHQQGLGAELTKALDQIVQTQGTSAQAAAIENYAKLAVAGVQAEAQRSKNQYGTQQTSLGIGSRDLASLKALAQTPAGKEMLIKQLGL